MRIDSISLTMQLLGPEPKVYKKAQMIRQLAQNHGLRTEDPCPTKTSGIENIELYGSFQQLRLFLEHLSPFIGRRGVFTIQRKGVKTTEKKPTRRETMTVAQIAEFPGA